MKLRHPKSDRKIEVTASQADGYKSQGWVEYREPATKPQDDPKKS
jgi:hypothetical protein